ncbi:MAG TPA: hypothetical protein V6C71_09775 [Coleofasciculaceae cyanobacterium]|jgi:hypothetical protein
MMQFQLQPDDPESASIIQESPSFFQVFGNSQVLSQTKSIDIMRMVNSAIVGFIAELTVANVNVTSLYR